MTLHMVLLAAIVVGALLAVLLTDLLRSAISLAFASVALSIIFFQLGVPYAAAIELSVGAGLVMVLLVSAIGMTRRTPPEQEEQGKSPVVIIPILALIAVAVIDISAFVTLNSQLRTSNPYLPAPASFSETLWQMRWVDILAQLGIVLAGVFAVLALFRKEGGLIGTPRDETPPDSEENLGS
jgi:NADH:ubiquinone oxidoreductase subunit 6 (subunit J)